jgi:hypothetical protein
MAAMMVLASLLISFGQLSFAAARAVNHVYPAIPPEKIAPLVPAVYLSLFVAVAEGWIWLMRIRTRLSLHLLDDLGERYSLAPVPKARATASAA